MQIQINYSLKIIDNAVIVAGNIGEGGTRIEVSKPDVISALAYVETQTNAICAPLLNPAPEVPEV